MRAEADYRAGLSPAVNRQEDTARTHDAEQQAIATRQAAQRAAAQPGYEYDHHRSSINRGPHLSL